MPNGSRQGSVVQSLQLPLNAWKLRRYLPSDRVELGAKHRDTGGDERGQKLGRRGLGE